MEVFPYGGQATVYPTCLVNTMTFDDLVMQSQGIISHDIDLP